MIIIKLFSRLPLSWLYLLSDSLYFFGYYVVGYRKRVVRSNLELSFPEKSIKDIRQIERKFYRNLSDFVVETLKAFTISPDELSRRVKFILPNDNDFAKTPVIGLASHQFNWEWLVLSGCIQLNMEIDMVYQPLKSKSFDNIILRLRTRFGGYAVKRSEVAREAIKRNNITRIIALVADQFPGRKNDKRYWTNFLGQETAFYQGIQQLAVLTQYPVYHFGIRKLKRGYYECSIRKVSDPPYSKNDVSIVESYIQQTEKMIHAEPEGWLWSHKRWKKTKQQMGD